VSYLLPADVYDANATDYQLHNKNEGVDCLACYETRSYCNELWQWQSIEVVMTTSGPSTQSLRFSLSLCMLVRATDYDWVLCVLRGTSSFTSTYIYPHPHPYPWRHLFGCTVISARTCKVMATETREAITRIIIRRKLLSHTRTL